MGHDIADLRKRSEVKQDVHNLSNIEAARQIGISTATYVDFMSGKRVTRDRVLDAIHEWVKPDPVIKGLTWVEKTTIGFILFWVGAVIYGIVQR